MKTAVLAFLLLFVGTQLHAQRITGSVSGSDANYASRTLDPLPEGLIFYEGFDNVSIPTLPSGWSTFSLGDDGFVTGTAGDETGQANAAQFWPVPFHGLFAMSNDDYCNCDKSTDRLTSPELDLSEHTYVRLGFSAFQNGSSGQSASVELRTSTIGWTTALEIPASAQWEEYSFNIPQAFMDDGFRMRFRYSDNNAYASGLALDDIFLSDEPTGLFSMEEFFSVDGNEAASGYLYHRIPETQAHHAELRFGAAVLNGDLTRKNARLGVEVTGPIAFGDTTTDWLSMPLEETNVKFPERDVFVPYALGDYSLQASLITDSVDAVTGDNLFSTSFSVSDSIYSRVEHNSDGTGILMLEQNERAGTVFNIFEEDTIEAVWVAIHPDCDSGARFRIKIFDFNILTSSIFQTPPKSVSGSDLDSEVRVKLDYAITPGKYLVVIEKESENDILAIATTSAVKAPQGVCLYQNVAEDWKHLAYYPFIDLVFPAVDEECPGHIQATITDESCEGQNDGSISLEVIDANISWTYTWSNGAGNVSSVDNLIPGPYQVAVNDASGCIYLRDFDIDAGDTIKIAPDIVVDSCAQGNAHVDLNLTGAREPYLITWNGQSHPSVRSGLSANTYAIHVEDRNGCIADTSVLVDGTSALNVVISSVPSGCGHSNGQLIASAFGTGPFTYEWTNGDTTDTVIGVASGIYDVTVGDSIGCETTVRAILNDSNAPIVTVQSKTDIACFGATDGSATVNASGGANPISYYWSNGDSLATIDELASGEYEVTVEDNNGCKSHALVTIENEASPLLLDFRETGIHCFGSSSGTIEALASGGSQPYDYSWSNGDDTPAITGLDEGSYTLTLTDNNDCELQATATIYAQPYFFYTIDSLFNDTADTAGGSSVFLSTFGGTPPYNYNWLHGYKKEDIVQVDSGLYTLVIRDQLGCQLEFEQYLGPYPLSVEDPGSDVPVFELYPNPAGPNALIYLDSEHPAQEVVILNVNGQIMDRQTVYGTTFSISNLAPGTYMVRIVVASDQVFHRKLVISNR